MDFWVFLDFLMSQNSSSKTCFLEVISGSIHGFWPSRRCCWKGRSFFSEKYGLLDFTVLCKLCWVDVSFLLESHQVCFLSQLYIIRYIGFLFTIDNLVADRSDAPGLSSIWSNSESFPETIVAFARPPPCPHLGGQAPYPAQLHLLTECKLSTTQATRQPT